MNKTESKQLYQKALAYFPGGVNSPVRAFKSVGGNPIFIKKGEGCKIWDEDDNENANHLEDYLFLLNKIYIDQKYYDIRYLFF